MINFDCTTMENTGQDQADDAFYTGIDNTRMTDPRLGKENNEVAHLYATQPIGPGLTVPVYPGDTIEMSVKAFHLGGDFSNTTTATALASALASAFTGISGATTEQGLNTAFNDAYGGAIIGNGTGTRPSAYLNYILFDKNMQAQHFGYVQVSELGAEETLSAAIVSDVEGFVFTYVSNESGQVGAEVYFDDFEVTIKESLVVQSTDYYPFGLQHSTSWTRVSNLKNNFLYNAGSELNEKTKNYEMFYRDYDAALGRMTAIDPMAIKYSSLTPYNYSFNDPIAFNDPLGDDPYTGLYGSRSSTPREGGVSDFVWDASEQYGFYRNYGEVTSLGHGNYSRISRQQGGGLTDWSSANEAFMMHAFKDFIGVLRSDVPSIEYMQAMINITLTNNKVGGAFYNGYTHDWTFFGNSIQEQDALFAYAADYNQQFDLYGKYEGWAMSKEKAYYSYADASDGIYIKEHNHFMRRMNGRGASGVDVVGDTDYEFWNLRPAQGVVSAWGIGTTGALLHKPRYTGKGDWSRLKKAGNRFAARLNLLSSGLIFADAALQGEFKNSHAADLVLTNAFTYGSRVPVIGGYVAALGVAYTVVDFAWYFYNDEGLMESILGK